MATLWCSCPYHTKISVRFQLWNCLGSCWELDDDPPLFTLLQLEMLTCDVKTSWRDEPLTRIPCPRDPTPWWFDYICCIVTYINTMWLDLAELCTLVQCPDKFLGIMAQNLGVSKPNLLHITFLISTIMLSRTDNIPRAIAWYPPHSLKMLCMLWTWFFFIHSRGILYTPLIWFAILLKTWTSPG